MPRVTRPPDSLDATLRALLLEGVRKSRSYEPEKVFRKIQDSLTYAESKLARPFLEWCIESGTGFSCNPSIREAWERYVDSIEPEPAPVADIPRYSSGWPRINVEEMARMFRALNEGPNADTIRIIPADELAAPQEPPTEEPQF